MLRTIFVAAGTSLVFIGGGIAWVALYDASNPVNSLNKVQLIAGGLAFCLGVTTIIAAFKVAQ